MLFAGCAAWAQLTLNDCLIYARDHSHGNIIRAVEQREAALDSRIAASDLMPYVGFSTSGNISFGRNIDPETNTYDNKKTLSSGFGLQMSIPLFDGLVSINRLKAAKVAHSRSGESVRIEQDRVSMEVIKAFYNVSYCKAMVAQIEQQLERDRKNLAAAERGYQLGTKSGADVAEMKAIVASDDYELANQQSLLSKAYLNLRSNMGMELSDSVLDLVEDDYSPEVGSGRMNPRIAEAALSLKESRYALRAARGAFSPTVSLNAGISTSYYKMLGSGITVPGFSRQWHDNMGQYVGFSVSVPLFTGLSRFNNVKRAALEVYRRETMLEQTRYEVERETAEARLDLRTATEEFTSAAARLEAEQAAFNAIQRKYELGGASAIDLYTSGAKLAAARAAYEGKRIQKIISRITLGYYNGEKLIR